MYEGQNRRMRGGGNMGNTSNGRRGQLIINSSSDSDDVPIIPTNPKKDTPVLVDLDSSVDSDSDIIEIAPLSKVKQPSEPHDGSSKRRKRSQVTDNSENEQEEPRRRRRRKESAPPEEENDTRRRRRRREVDESEDSEDEKEREPRRRRRRRHESDNSDDDNEEREPRRRRRRIQESESSEEEKPQRRRRRKRTNESDEEEEQKDESSSSEEEVRERRKHRKRTSEAVNEEKEAQEIKPNLNDLKNSHTTNKYTPDPIPEGIQSYTIIRHKKMFGGSVYNMLANEKLIFTNEIDEDKITKIVKVLRGNKNDPDRYQGFIRLHENKHRFTVVSTCTKENDDRDGELMGIYFTKGATGRKMQVVVTKGIVPFFPISRRLNLSRVAKADYRIAKFDYFETTQKPDDNFESDLTIKSVKNFKLVDPETNKMIFQIYKYGGDEYSVKSCAPFNSLLTYCLAVACICSE